MQFQVIFVFLTAFLATKSDATISFTVPTTSGTPAACPTNGSMPEGTKSGTVVTAHATGTGKISYSLLAATDANFDVAAATGVVTVSSAASLDYEQTTSVQVIVIAIDANDSSTASATCIVAITDVAPRFELQLKTLVIDPFISPGGDIAKIGCTDGAGTVTKALASGDDATAAKFSFNPGTGVLVKSANAFDTATKTNYSLVFTCTDGTATTTATVGVYLRQRSENKASINTGILPGLTVSTLYVIYNVI